RSTTFLRPETVAKIYRAKIDRSSDHTIVEASHDYHYFTGIRGHLDGRPLMLECWSRICTATLVISPSFLGLTAKPGEGVDPSAGSALVISFHPWRISVWPQIRRKSVCFAALSIDDVRMGAISLGVPHACDDVRAAIASKIGKA